MESTKIFPSEFSPLASPSPAAANSSIVPFLLAIGGATATGKSALAIALAQRFAQAQGAGGVILSADSRQVYREFDIGTAKPSPLEQQQVPHHLIDICDPTDTLTLAQYQAQAQALVLACHRRGARPLLVGGTGLYIDAVVKGLRIPPVAPQPTLRHQLAALGQVHCHALLTSLDPAAARRIHPRDAVRTVRALEVYYVTGQPLSALQGESPPDYPVLFLALGCDPLALEQRIARRTQAMLDAGLVDEVAGLAQRYGPQLPLLQTLGYAEVLRHLQGEISLATAQAEIVQHTRQFAKRQGTWFRNRATGQWPLQWFDAAAPGLVDQVWAWVLTQLQDRASARAIAPGP